jgi:hypothetical protein
MVLNPTLYFNRSFEDLTKMMNRSNSRRIIVILDCCYSGSANPVLTLYQVKFVGGGFEIPMPIVD